MREATQNRWVRINAEAASLRRHLYAYRAARLTSVRMRLSKPTSSSTANLIPVRIDHAANADFLVGRITNIRMAA